MYSPYSRAFSGEFTRPRRKSSPKTRIEASGVRSSWETLETKSFFISESRISRAVVRNTSARAPSSTTPRASDRVTLKAKLARAHCCGVEVRPRRASRQSVKRKENGRVISPSVTVPGSAGQIVWPALSRTETTTSPAGAESGNESSTARGSTWSRK